MWILPSQCQVTALWESIKEDSFFVIQKSSLLTDFTNTTNNTNSKELPSKWSFTSIVGTISSMINPPQYPFRLLLKKDPLTSQQILPGDEGITIAVSSNIKELLLDWDQIHSNIPTDDILDRKEMIQFFISRIRLDFLGAQSCSSADASTAVQQDLDPQLRRHMISFKQTFGIDDPNDRLLSAHPTSISHSSDGKEFNKSKQGWLFISEDHLAHHSLLFGRETRWIIRMSQLISVRRIGSGVSGSGDQQDRKSNSSILLRISSFIFVGNSVLLEWREPMMERKWTVFSNLMGKDLLIFESLISLKNMHSGYTNSPSTTTLSTTTTTLSTPQLPLKESLRERKEIDALELRFNLTNLTSPIHPLYGRAKIDFCWGDLIVLEKYLIHQTSTTLYTIIPISFIEAIEEEKDKDKEEEKEKKGHHLLVRLPSTVLKVEFETYECSLILLHCTKRLNSFAKKVSIDFFDDSLGPTYGYFDCEFDDIGGFDGFDDITDHSTTTKPTTETDTTNPIVHHLFKSPSNEERGAFWFRMSGAFYSNVIEGVSLRNGNNSNNIITNGQQRKQNSDSITDIEKDIERTMPEYKGFRCQSGKKKLRDVLLWYSHHNKGIGYCQSMNLITAFLLIWCPSVMASSLLDKICTKILPQYFVKSNFSMEGAILDQHCLEKIIKRHLPLLDVQLREKGVNVALITLPLLLSIGLAGANQKGAFSFATVALVWDHVLFECHIAPLFRVLLSLLKKVQGKYFMDESSFIRIWKDEIETVEDWRQFIAASINEWHQWVNGDVIGELRAQNMLWVREEIRTFQVRRSVREARNAVCTTTTTADFDRPLFLRRLYEHWDLLSSKGRFHLFLKEIWKGWPTSSGTTIESFILNGLFEANFQYDWISFIKRLSYLHMLSLKEIHQLIFEYATSNDSQSSPNLQLTEIYLYLIPEDNCDNADNDDDWECRRITDITAITKHDEFTSFGDFFSFLETVKFVKFFFETKPILSLLLKKDLSSLLFDSSSVPDDGNIIRTDGDDSKGTFNSNCNNNNINEITPHLDHLISLTKKDGKYNEQQQQQKQQQQQLNSEGPMSALLDEFNSILPS